MKLGNERMFNLHAYFWRLYALPMLINIGQASMATHLHLSQGFLALTLIHFRRYNFFHIPLTFFSIYLFIYLLSEFIPSFPTLLA